MNLTPISNLARFVFVLARLNLLPFPNWDFPRDGDPPILDEKCPKTKSKKKILVEKWFCPLSHGRLVSDPAKVHSSPTPIYFPLPHSDGPSMWKMQIHFLLLRSLILQSMQYLSKFCFLSIICHRLWCDILFQFVNLSLIAHMANVKMKRNFLHIQLQMFIVLETKWCGQCYAFDAFCVSLFPQFQRFLILNSVDNRHGGIICCLVRWQIFMSHVPLHS